MPRIMSIDYGDVRVGIALTDPLQIIASGYQTLKHTNTILQDILDICLNKEVESIVVGIPFDQNSEVGSTAKKVLLFTKSLQDHFEKNNIILPFYEQDERYSTRDAIDSMREFKVKKKRKRKIVDQIAAAKILSNFMNSQSKIILDFSKYPLDEYRKDLQP